MNPLGFGGRLAEVFAEFMRHMWNGMNRAYEPTKIKVCGIIRITEVQFTNFFHAYKLHICNHVGHVFQIRLKDTN